jgi:hypothetical protein
LYLDQEPLQPKGWPTSPWRIWQFTDSGRLRGSGSRVLDLNVYRGSSAQLLAEAGLGPEAAEQYDLPLDAVPEPTESATPTVSPSESASVTP